MQQSSIYVAKRLHNHVVILIPSRRPPPPPPQQTWKRRKKEEDSDYDAHHLYVECKRQVLLRTSAAAHLLPGVWVRSRGRANEKPGFHGRR